jgi:hypothetical protein
MRPMGHCPPTTQNVNNQTEKYKHLKYDHFDNNIQ